MFKLQDQGIQIVKLMLPLKIPGFKKRVIDEKLLSSMAQMATCTLNGEV